MSASDSLILVTGAAGKVGRAFIDRLLVEKTFAWSWAGVRATIWSAWSNRLRAISGRPTIHARSGIRAQITTVR
jgi:nucleoside-diphosphate-sugar epimerase